MELAQGQIQPQDTNQTQIALWMYRCVNIQEEHLRNLLNFSTKTFLETSRGTPKIETLQRQGSTRHRQSCCSLGSLKWLRNWSVNTKDLLLPRSRFREILRFIPGVYGKPVLNISGNSWLSFWTFIPTGHS